MAPAAKTALVMMSRRVILFSRVLVAGCTQTVVIKFDFHAVRIMAIRALDTLVIHLALNE